MKFDSTRFFRKTANVAVFVLASMAFVVGIIYAALSWPTSVPPGQTENGSFMTVFKNMFAGCPSGKVINAFKPNGTPVCVAIVVPVKVDGQCGSNDGKMLSAKPVSWLCSAGTASSVATITSNDYCPNKYTIRDNRITRYSTSTYAQWLAKLPTYTETGDLGTDYVCDVYISKADQNAWGWDGYGTLKLYRAKSGRLVFVAPWISSNGVYYTYPLNPDPVWKWTCSGSNGGTTDTCSATQAP